MPRWLARLKRSRLFGRRSHESRRLRMAPRVEPLEERRLLAVGAAVDLNGTTQYLTAPTPGVSLSQMTIEAWVRHQGSGSEAILSAGSDQSFMLSITGGKVRFQTQPLELPTNIVPFDATVYGVTTIPVDTWTHVAVVFTPELYTLIYVNGVFEAAEFTPYAVGAPRSNLTIGANEVTSGASTVRTNLLDGNLAEVRLWNTVRTQDEIRRTMHTTLGERLPGLVRDWSLASFGPELISGQTPTAVGQPVFQLTTPRAPVSPATVPVDENFGQLPAALYDAATAYVSDLDSALLVGGRRTMPGAVSDVLLVNASTGASSLLTSLSQPLRGAAAVYAPTTGWVYVFGGIEDDGFNANYRTKPLAINPRTGEVRTLSPTLARQVGAEAVWDSQTGRVLLLGGVNTSGTPLRTAYVFDPATETLQTLNLQTPALYDFGAAYSEATGKTYYFGGTDTGGATTSSIYEISYSLATGAGTATLLTAQLPANATSLAPVVDPVSELIYVLGNSGRGPVVFDPLERQVFVSSIAYPLNAQGATRVPSSGSSAVYSPVSRQAVLLGGNSTEASLKTIMWRMKLGDGAVIPLERWDFYRPFTAGNITSIDGDEAGVVVGNSAGQGVRLLDGTAANGATTNPAAAAGLNNLGQINGVAYGSDGRIWVGSDAAGAYAITAGPLPSFTLLQAPTIASNRVFDIEPTRQAFGTDNGLTGKALASNPAPYSTVLPGSRVTELTAGPGGEVWAISERKVLVGSFLTTVYELQQTYPIVYFVGPQIQSVWLADTYSNPGNYLTTLKDLVFDKENHLWLAGTGLAPTFLNPGQERQATLFIPNAETPATFNPLSNTNGYEAVSIDVDADNRVWVAINGENSATGEFGKLGYSGGLTAYEAKGVSIRTTDYNWLNAPLGSRQNRGQGVWDSSVDQVAAVDEKVYAAQDGELITLAQRWQQLDENNNLDLEALDGVWTARGRTFFSSGSGTFVLQPDGVTWDNRPGVPSLAVMDDSQGRIWVGTPLGVRLYLSTGWDTLDDKLGTRPTGSIRALAEDAQGRVWIGGDNGLTLFDRERFVFTLTPANSSLPSAHIRSLLVDQNNQLWIGTDAGLVRWNLSGAENMQVLTTAQGLPNNTVVSLAQLGTGEVAVSTANGLVWWRDGGFQTLIPPIAAQSLPLAVDELGRLWAGSALLNGNAWEGYYWTDSGLRSSHVAGVATDGADRVWFVHAPDTGVSVRGSILPPLRDAVPLVNNVSPRWGSGQAGENVVNIIGSGFGAAGDDLKVTIGGVAVTVLSRTDTQISVLITNQIQTGEVLVVRGARRAEYAPGDGKADFAAIPHISSYTPTGGNDGVLVTVYGINFDRDAKISLGSGVPRSVSYVSPTQVQVLIAAGDTDGALQVYNAQYRANDATTNRFVAAGTVTFHHITLTFDRVVLNQGLEAYGLYTDKPTLAQSYLIRNQSLRGLGFKDVLDVDSMLYIFHTPSGAEYTYTFTQVDPKTPDKAFSYTATLGEDKTLLAPPTDAQLRDLANSFNVTPLYFREAGLNTVEVQLKRRATVVASTSVTVQVNESAVQRILLVPVMKEGYSAADLANLQRNTMLELLQAEQRALPIGRIEFDWAFDVLTENYSSPINLGGDDAGTILAKLALTNKLDRIKSRWNDRASGRDVGFVMGIMDDRLLVPNGSPGTAFGPDAFGWAGELTLDAIDALCDAANALINTVTFGLLGDDEECEIAAVTGVALIQGNSTVSTSLTVRVPLSGEFSRIVTHELGHLLGLVSPDALNYSDDEAEVGQVGHSRANEMTLYLPNEAYVPKVASPNFAIEHTFDAQIAVTQPIVNPLYPVSQAQLRPNLAPPEDQFSERAKSLMSYALERNDKTAFFEPLDVFNILGWEQTAALGHLEDFQRLNEPGGPLPAAASTAESLEAGASAVDLDAPRATAMAMAAASGPRLVIAGRIDGPADQGSIDSVDSLSESGETSLSFDTGYYLVQRDGLGNELSRVGVLVAEEVIEHLDGQVPPEHDHGHGDDHASRGMFSVIVSRQPGVSSIQLLHHDEVLATYAPGASAPALTVGSSFGGTYTNQMIPINVTVSDPNGDPVTVWVSFTNDLGATWTSVGSRVGSGSMTVPASILPASTSAVFSIVASDGLHETAYITPPFAIGNHAPNAWISSPAPALVPLEGELITFAGGAIDTEDGRLGDASLRWVSNRDGELGTGASLSRALSFGPHIITLYATDHNGLTATATVQINVDSDYLGDGVPDSLQLARKMNPLDRTAASRLGSNGLSYREELAWGLAPGAPEPAPVAPLVQTLAVSPSALEFEVDLSLPVPLPQRIINIGGPGAFQWQLSSEVGWLMADKLQGQGSAAINVLVNAYELADGTYHAQLNFTSDTLGQDAVIPVTVHVTNRMAYYDVNDDGHVDDDDRHRIIDLFGNEMGQAGYDYRADLNRDGFIDNRDLGVANDVISPTGLIGDANGDCVVGTADYAIWAAQFGQSDVGLSADFDGNGSVGSGDYALWAANFGATCMPPELIGDANHDGEVGVADYAIWAAQVGQVGPNLSADFDGSGSVGSGDYVLWAANFGATSDMVGAAVANGASLEEPTGAFPSDSAKEDPAGGEFATTTVVAGPEAEPVEPAARSLWDRKVGSIWNAAVDSQVPAAPSALVAVLPATALMQATAAPSSIEPTGAAPPRAASAAAIALFGGESFGPPSGPAPFLPSSVSPSAKFSQAWSASREASDRVMAVSDDWPALALAGSLAGESGIASAQSPADEALEELALEWVAASSQAGKRGNR